MVNVWPFAGVKPAGVSRRPYSVVEAAAQLKARGRLDVEREDTALAYAAVEPDASVVAAGKLTVPMYFEASAYKGAVQAALSLMGVGVALYRCRRKASTQVV